MWKKALILLIGLPVAVLANVYEGQRYATTEGKVYKHTSGEWGVAASTASWSTYTITLKGEGGQIALPLLNAWH